MHRYTARMTRVASDSTALPPAPSRGLGAALGWAFFLGASWTWVIGMFFPILLVRDYGFWGWVVFAVPNVVGAAAMGFVLRDAEHSRRVMDEHLGACVRFSEVTIAFHAFMAVWAYVVLMGVLGPTLALGLAVPAWLLAIRDRTAIAAAIVVTCVTVAAWLAFLGAFGNVYANATTSTPALGWFDLAMFAPAALTGFALCPYLDATFHRARQATDPAGGRVAFAVGFGVVFFLSIVFSLGYSGVLRGLFALDTGGEPALALQLTSLLLGAHLVLQLALTVGLHAREANEDPASRTPSPRLLLPIVLGGVLGAVALLDREALALGVSQSTGEFLYRSFLLFYGLVFPAYVFLVMLPTRRPVSRPVKVASFLFATITALPFAAGGFVYGASWMIPVSLGILVVTRLAVAVMAAPEETRV